MAHLIIREFPDPALRKECEIIERMGAGTRQFIENLAKKMYSEPGGIGIAAPQVGVMKKIAIVDVSRKVPGAKQLILINPVIEAVEDMGISREGCMSLPHFTANVKRANKIRVRFQDINLKMQTMAASGIEAICIQHEVDHLNGLLFLDRVSCLKTDVFKRKKYL